MKRKRCMFECIEVMLTFAIRSHISEFNYQLTQQVVVLVVADVAQVASNRGLESDVVATRSKLVYPAILYSRHNVHVHWLQKGIQKIQHDICVTSMRFIYIIITVHIKTHIGRHLIIGAGSCIVRSWLVLAGSGTFISSVANSSQQAFSLSACKAGVWASVSF